MGPRGQELSNNDLKLGKTSDNRLVLWYSGDTPRPNLEPLPAMHLCATSGHDGLPKLV